ncbi:Ribosomal protein S19, mitochondrial [Capsicum annuum]|nr:Ribosomal protein S19, mitochondrial [Capsicum annuum]
MPRQSIWKGSFVDPFLLRMKKKRDLLFNRKIWSLRSSMRQRRALRQFTLSTGKSAGGGGKILKGFIATCYGRKEPSFDPIYPLQRDVQPDIPHPEVFGLDGMEGHAIESTLSKGDSYKPILGLNGFGWHRSLSGRRRGCISGTGVQHEDVDVNSAPILLAMPYLVPLPQHGGGSIARHENRDKGRLSNSSKPPYLIPT